MREIICLNNDWKFHEGDFPAYTPAKKDPVYMQAKTVRKNYGPAAVCYNDLSDHYDANVLCNSELWQSVNLPHDYTITHDFDAHENNTLGFLPKTNGWYRKHFTLCETDRDLRISVYFEGVSTLCDVYINGTPVSHNYSAYNSFEVDLTDLLYYDGSDNVLAVYTSTAEFEGWWYQGGGIYRSVWLRKTSRTAIDLWGVYAFPVQEGERWRIPVAVTVRNDDYTAHTFRFRTELIAPDGALLTVASGEDSVDAQCKGTLSETVFVSHPLLWDTECPNLYTVRTTLYVDGQSESVDADTTRTGFRTVVMDPEKGLFLNGKHIKLKGICGHQDFGLTGLAVPDNILRYKVQLLREMGANGYRTSHYMQPAALMDALDEAGFLVMDENRWFDTSEETLKQVDALILRDRNRPSVIFWSTSNEELTHITDTGRRIQDKLAAHIRRLDNNRPITCAVSNAPLDATVYGGCDAIGVNYNLDAFDGLHEKYPNLPIFSSENCATSSTRGWYYENCPARGYMTAYDQATSNWFRGREETWNHFMARDYILGGYQWDSMEHRGESVWPRLCSQAGAIDLFYQRKDAFYQNQSLWTTAPMVHLLPHWNWQGMELQPIRVSAYTNCEELELFLNGKSLGRKAIPTYSHGEWSVPFEAGTLHVIGYRNGVAVAEDTRKTAGPAVRLMLKKENEAAANGQDLALFTCTCVDAEGNPVPDATPTVSFSTNGKGEIVGTGADVCDHARVSLPTRRMWAGCATVGVRVSEGHGDTLTVVAEAEGLTRAVLAVRF